MSKKKIVWLSVVVFFVLSLGGLALVGPLMSAVEKPKYEVLVSQGAVEVRRYAPMILAVVDVPGERKEAIEQGFRLLADYIFGNNSFKKQIAAASPVAQQESKKIAMTAPVMQQSTKTAWKVSFVMPAEYSLESLPVPNNAAVQLRPVAAKDFVVVQFSGKNTDENLAKNEQRLMDYVTSEQLAVVGSPIYAFYNPPWTLPLMRTYEVMIEVQR